jgi:hypothetical protein
MSKLFEDQAAIKPVWQVIPQFFRYPLKKTVLPTLLFISAASLLTLIPVIGFFVWILLWAMLFKVSYEILTSTASGEMDGPPSVSEMSDGIMFKHIGLLIGLAILYGLLVGFFGSVLVAVLLGVFFLLILPAAIMTLAMTQSLTQALNPVMWIQIMRTTGASYLLTSVFLLLMLFSQAQTESLLLPIFGGSMILVIVISMMISAYFMAASFHLMGYLLYQYHEEFGIEISETIPLARPGRDESPLLTEATAMVQDGQTEQAAEYLGREIERSGAEPAVHDYYRKLLHSQGDSSALVKHGKQYIPILIHCNEDLNAALDVAEECLKIDRQFQPPNPDDICVLARRAFQQRRHALVLRLTNGFSKQHPRHPDLVENYFLAAQAMVEQKGDTTKAVGLTRKLLERFPEHPLASDMSRFEASFSS